MAAPCLDLKGIEKNFGAFQALRDIHLTVEQGEFLCLLGPSGCGKTTLLRIISGLEQPTAGVLAHQGRDITRLPPPARGFGIVFQSYALFPNLTAIQNVAYGLYVKPGSKEQKRERALACLRLVGLEHAADKHPAQLSGGQQQRVALARALAPEPALLLLDEPLSALDAKVRQSLREQLRHLQKSLGVTTVMVTHDQEEALGLSDRVAVMDHGVLVQVDTPTALYDAPKNLFVADFVGAMNFLKATSNGGGHYTLGTENLQAASDLPSGQAVTLAIRPQLVQLGAPTGPNTLSATVADAEYRGSGWRVRLVLGQGQSLAIDIGETRTSPELHQEGATVKITLPPEDLRVFAETP